MGWQAIGVVKYRGNGQVFAAHGAINDYLQSFHCSKHIYRAPVAASSVMIKDEHQATSLVLIRPDRLIVSSVQTPAASPDPTPSKNESMAAKRDLLFTAVLIT